MLESIEPENHSSFKLGDNYIDVWIESVSLELEKNAVQRPKNLSCERCLSPLIDNPLHLC